MKIISYDKKYKKDFIEMNKAWIKEMFTLEPSDEKEFENIDSAIQSGGQIFFALDETSEEVMACCMICPRSDGDWEIIKFAADPKFAGKGAGTACLKACIDYAKKISIKKVIIVSNKKCTHAIHLYRKFGFTEIPVDSQKFPFKRANIAFEMEF